MSNEDDEWETAEVQIQNLSVDRNEPAKPPMVFNRMQQKSNSPDIAVRPYTEQQPSLRMLPEEPIDSALLNAISNPRERMVLLQIENSILNFMNSSKEYMDIPPGYNSFRRLLAYRVGQRFKLNHTTSDQLSENGERGIRLYKTAASGHPNILLIDLNIPVQNDQYNTPQFGAQFRPATEQGRLYNPNSGYINPPQGEGFYEDERGLGRSTEEEGPVSPDGGRKVQVMKRKPTRSTTGSQKQSTGRQQQSAEDREKAYQEARARIFGEEATVEATEVNTGVSTVPVESGIVAEVTKTNSSKEVNNVEVEKSSGKKSPLKVGSTESTRTSTTGQNNPSKKDNNYSNVKGDNNSGKNSPTVEQSSQKKQSQQKSNKNNTTNEGQNKKGSSKNTTANNNQNENNQTVGGKLQSTDVQNQQKIEENTKKKTPEITKKNNKNSKNKKDEKTMNETNSTKSIKSNEKTPTEDSESVSPSGSINSNNNNNPVGRKVVNVSNWKENKSQVRDVDVERLDPDFVRRTSPGPAYMSNNNPANPNIGVNMAGKDMNQAQARAYGYPTGAVGVAYDASIYNQQGNMMYQQQMTQPGQPQMNVPQFVPEMMQGGIMYAAGMVAPQNNFQGQNMPMMMPLPHNPGFDPNYINTGFQYTQQPQVPGLEAQAVPPAAAYYPMMVTPQGQGMVAMGGGDAGWAQAQNMGMMVGAVANPYYPPNYPPAPPTLQTPTEAPTSLYKDGGDGVGEKVGGGDSGGRKLLKKPGGSTGLQGNRNNNKNNSNSSKTNDKDFPPLSG